MSRKSSSFYTDYIIKEYGAGASAENIGRAIGFSNVTVTSILKAHGIVIRGNVRNIPIDIIKKHLADGLSINSTARTLGVTGKVISRILVNNGIEARQKPIVLPKDFIINAHNAGVGVSGIAKKLGISANVVARNFKSIGIKTRSRSEQQFVRMANSTPDQIKQLTTNAHNAVKGRKRSIEERSKSAITRHENGSQRISKYETDLLFMLREKGLVCGEQTPIGPYNCDITTDTVAVEVWGGHWHFHGEHAARNEERFRYILNSGRHIIAIVISRSYPLTSAVADYLVRVINHLSGDPSSRRQYRVIWGAGDKLAGGCVDDDQISIKPALAGRFYLAA